MLRKVAIVVVVIGIGLVIAVYGLMRSAASASGNPAHFEDAIVAFEADDAESPPAPGGIVFVGSSSIRFWNSLEDDMAPLHVVERGFGGAHIEHVIHNADRIVLGYEPRAVVVYAGDNDLAEGTGKNIDAVVGDFETLMAMIRRQQPELPVYFVTIKPSRMRWDRWPTMAEANQRIAALAEQDPFLSMLDIATPMLAAPDDEGRPSSDLFMIDGLHLSDQGYAMWTDAIRPRLLADHPTASDTPSP